MDIYQGVLACLQLSASVNQLVLPQSANSELFIIYAIVSITTKRPSYLAAFFMSCLLFELAFFDPLAEYQLYLLIFIIYSFVFQQCDTLKSKTACGIMLIIWLMLATDAALFGVNGYYGEYETSIYKSIEFISLYTHILFIGSLVNYKRIRGHLRNIISFALHISRNSAYFVFC